MSPNQTDIEAPKAAEQPAAADTAAAEPEKKKKPKKSKRSKKPRKSRKGLVILIVILVVIALAAVYIFVIRKPADNQSSAQYTDYTVTERDVTQSLSGTGTLSPANSYTVTSLLSGDILTASFEEGDTVQQGDVLYTIDDSDARTSIQQAQNSLDQAQRAYEQNVKSLDQLNVTSALEGTVTGLNVNVGDTVTPGETVATVMDSSTMSLVIPFGADDAANFYVGESATVTLDGTFEQLPGTISKIAATNGVLTGNMLVRQVTIDVSNPGGITTSQTATAMVGDAACNQSGTFIYKAQGNVTAAVAGTVASIKAREGDWVNQNQLILTLTSDSLANAVQNAQDSVQNAQTSLQSAQSKLSNYTVTSPISGTIIEKDCKAGDTLQSGETMCTIYDLSYLTLTLNVDELDISNIHVGQTAVITADAAPGKTYQGTVTNVNINGTTSNGATSYPVTVELDSTDGLLPGMNVQADITLQSANHVVAIPVTALLRGDYVLVKDGSASGAASGSTAAENTARPSGEGGGFTGRGEEYGGGDNQSAASAPASPGAVQESPNAGGENQPAASAPASPNAGVPQPSASTAGLSPAVASGVPAGYTAVRVTTGVSDGDYIEITSGLTAGEVIGIPVTQTAVSTSSGSGDDGFGIGGIGGGGSVGAGEYRGATGGTAGGVRTGTAGTTGAAGTGTVGAGAGTAGGGGAAGAAARAGG